MFTFADRSVPACPMREYYMKRIILTGMLLVTFALTACAQTQVQRDVPYVPTPQSIVDQMLQMANVGPDDVIYDLGCGDGRIVVTAAKEFGATGVGIDIDPNRIEDSHRTAREAGVEDKVTFRQENIFTADFSQATVVTLYLLSRVNLQLRPQLFAQLKPGTRLVSHNYHMSDWEADEHVPMEGHDIYYWIIPANFSGVWRWNIPDEFGGGDVMLAVKQIFQHFTGVMVFNDMEVDVADPEIEGETISFALGGDDMMGVTRFTGRISGDTITGTVTTEGMDAMPWSAKRDPDSMGPILPAEE